jgi:hypothetical protein
MVLLLEKMNEKARAAEKSLNYAIFSEARQSSHYTEKADYAFRLFALYVFTISVVRKFDIPPIIKYCFGLKLFHVALLFNATLHYTFTRH